MPHFQVVLTDGTVLGAMELGRPDWPEGSLINRGPGEPDLRVLDRLPAVDSERHFDILVVEEA